MKAKYFISFILFLAISAVSYAQTQTDAPAAKKDAPVQQTTVDQSKGCSGHQGEAIGKADCKWVDANNDGVCDTCGSKTCKDQSKASGSKNCDPGCHSKDAVKPSGDCPSKDGKKPK